MRILIAGAGGQLGRSLVDPDLPVVCVGWGDAVAWANARSLADGLTPGTIAAWRDAPAAAFLFPLIGIALAPIYPTIVSVMLSAMPHREHPPLMGLVVVFSALGGTTGSVITGALFAHLDGRTAFTLMLVPTALLAAGLFLLRRRIEHRAGRAPA